MTTPPPLGPSDRLVTRLVFWQRLPVVGPVIRQMLKLMGTDIPPSTLERAVGLTLPHCAKVTIHQRARIGRNVTLVQGCNVGASVVGGDVDIDRIDIGDHAVIGINAAVLCKPGQRLTIAPGTIVGANSVLTRSTGVGEIWAGNPARMLRVREDRFAD